MGDILGRQVKTVYPDNPYTENVYDEAGCLIQSIDELSHATEYNYLRREVALYILFRKATEPSYPCEEPILPAELATARWEAVG